MTPVVRVVGLGPGDVTLLTRRTFDLLTTAPVVRLRTRVHPAAAAFDDLASYDELYERAESFDALYDAIVVDLIELARSAPGGEVLYAVPGSPIVAERTVELLLASTDVETILEPAVSVIDVACAAMRTRPDDERTARRSTRSRTPNRLRGPGPLLVLQTYSQRSACQRRRSPADDDARHGVAPRGTE